MSDLLDKCQHVSGGCSPVQECGAASALLEVQCLQAAALRLRQPLGACSCLECHLVQRSHAQFVGERKVVVCLTVLWSFHRNPVKSDTNISVVKDQLSSKETQEP